VSANVRASGPLKLSAVEPVFSQEPDLRCESGKLVAWFTDPPGAVVQLRDAAVFTKAMADWFVGPAFAALVQRFPNAKDMRLLLDLRPMLSREPAARPVLMTAANNSMFAFAKIGLIPPARPLPLYMSTLYGAVALLSTIGPEIRIYETLEGALLHMAVAAASSSPAATK
jgi:hypothetical protein